MGKTKGDEARSFPCVAALDWNGSLAEMLQGFRSCLVCQCRCGELEAEYPLCFRAKWLSDVNQ